MKHEHVKVVVPLFQGLIHSDSLHPQLHSQSLVVQVAQSIQRQLCLSLLQEGRLDLDLLINLSASNDRPLLRIGRPHAARSCAFALSLLALVRPAGTNNELALANVVD